MFLLGFRRMTIPNVVPRSNAPKGATTLPKDDKVDLLPGVDASAETANLDGDECLSFLTR